MDAVAVAEVFVVTARQVEPVRIVEPLGVAVRGGEYDENGVAHRDALPAEPDGLGGVTPGGQLHRPVVAQQFLDPGRQEPGLAGVEERWSLARCSG